VTALHLAVLCLAAPAAPAGVLEPYAQPRQQLDLAFGHRSYWHQPWRAYVDTWPATRLIEGTGVNFHVPADLADAVAQHLARNGFRHVRIEIGWGSFNYDDPTNLNNRAQFEAVVGACKKHGLRPLLLLNAHHGYPCPLKSIHVRVAEPAAQGATQVRLENAADVVPGYTGFNGFGEYWAARVIITALDKQTGAAQLSRPLPGPLAAGDQELYVLKYQPFGRLTLPDGKPNPAGVETLEGWGTYVKALTTAAKQVLGTEGAADAGFDLEVWNELTFGSNFLSINNYYEPKKFEGFQWVIGDMVARTVQYVNDPANGLPGVHVGDGFNNQWPWGSGSGAPAGLHAINKHPYTGFRQFPEADNGEGAYRLQPLNALGQPDGTVAAGNYFKPTFSLLMPEYCLCAYQTEHIIRDLSPYTTDIYGTRHGRFTHPQGGAPVTMWITETGIAPNERDKDVSAEAALHIKGKTTLRYLTSYIGKGCEFLTLFGAIEGDKWLGLVADRFVEAVKAAKGAYPADDAALTSPAMYATRNLVRAMTGAQPIRYTRALELARIEEPEERLVFAGDGRPEHPSVHNRDIFAFLPFQVDDRTFAIPYYVMTRDVMQAWRPELPAQDLARYDMPPEQFILDISNVRGAGAKVSAYDPLHDTPVPVEVLGGTGSTLRVRVTAADYPYVLRIAENAAGPLILDPRIEPAADGTATVTFRTNIASDSIVTVGGDTSRTGVAEVTQPRPATKHEVKLKGIPPGGTHYVRVRVIARGLTAVWPQWDEDVQGVFRIP